MSSRPWQAIDEVRVVVIRGAGKIFSSGHNLREMTGRALDEQREVFDVCTEMMQTVQQIPQPVIAQVHGVAAAAGCQLVATCDLAVAADSTLFLTPGVRIGLFCSTPMVALSRNVGASVRWRCCSPVTRSQPRPPSSGA